MESLTDHPLRYALANELHARPFPQIGCPARAAYLALTPVNNAAGRDRAADRAHLIALLDRFGAAHPQPGATHYSGRLGRAVLKWESHTEFVTFTLFEEGPLGRPFAPEEFEAFPADWLAQTQSTRVTSALIRIEPLGAVEEVAARADDWFVPESLAISRVLDDALVVAGDFRIDAAGHLRMAIFADPECNARRIGRVVQRLCEIETYKSMAMLGLARARSLSGPMAQIEARLTALVAEMNEDVPAEQTLHGLLTASSELERLIAEHSFRFGATGAYEAIVSQRIAVLREARFEGRQSFGEFMMRRFDPAMRTVKSAETRLKEMAGRAARAAELLRTRVDVERSGQNQALLASMDRRADQALRLQHTVEGLSVVAISYYALSLAGYLVAPLAEAWGLSKPAMMAALMPVVLGLVWLAVRRVRKHMEPRGFWPSKGAAWALQMRATARS